MVVKPRDPSKDYVVLKGYFRSYQMHDDVPVYFSDGICEYYVPLKKRGKTLIKPVQNRAFRNPKALVSKKSKNGNTIGFKYVGMPYRVLPKTSLEKLRQKTTTQKIDNNYFFKRNGQTIGKATLDTLSKRMFLDIDDFGTMKRKRSYRDYIYRVKNYGVSEIHNTSSFPLVSNEFLDSKKSYEKIFVKHKSDTDFTKVEVVKEFYTQEVRFVRKENIGYIKPLFMAMIASQSNTRYWEEIELSDLPLMISNALGAELKMR